MTTTAALCPPEELIFVGDGDFTAIGNEFLRYFIELGGLQPSHRVLDVGCGIGRMAIPLTRYLNDQGRYEGLDVVPLGIDWCRAHITPRYPAFRFQVADLYNSSYNPAGRQLAEEYDFPYPDASFDFAFLTSVFTHMLPRAVERYVAELGRVLAPGGRCLVTCFLWNAESAALTLTDRSGLQLPHHRGVYHVADEAQPENAVGFNEDYLLGLFARHGLEVDHPVHYGRWCGRPRHLSSQDILLATRTARPAERSDRPRPAPVALAVEPPKEVEGGAGHRSISPAVRRHIEGRLVQRQIARSAAVPADSTAAPGVPPSADPTQQVRDLEERLRQTEQLVGQLQATLARIYWSRGWAVLNRYYALRERLFPTGSGRFKAARLLYRNGRRLYRWALGTGPVCPSALSEQSYASWLSRHEPTTADLARQRAERFAYAPRMSLVVDAGETPVAHLCGLLDSILAQTYAGWELLAVVRPGTGSAVRRTLRHYAQTEPRIRLHALAADAGLTAALADAGGDYVALVGGGDTLAPFALHAVVRAVNTHRDADLVYSDEDRLDAAGRRCQPHFKPDWSPDTLRSHNYLGRLVVLARPLVDRLGTPGRLDAAAEYDLALRATEQARHVVHVPQLLYHRRQAGPVDDAAADRAALLAHLRRTGVDGDVIAGRQPGTYRVVRPLRGRPLVSIIIPTRDQQPVLARCLESIRQSSYDNYEILIVENSSADPATFAYYRQLEGWPRLRLLRQDGPFNYSAANNRAARAAQGDLLLLLNNDTEVLNVDWLERLLEHAVRPEVGAVGAKLYFPDGTIQHGGVILGIGGVAGHSHRFRPGDSPGYLNRLVTTQNVSAVTGACLMLRKRLFDELGGLDERYALAYNDVDLCMRIRRAGYAILWTPHAELVHHEMKTRGKDDTPEKKARFAAEARQFLTDWWQVVQAGDPFYNPNLTLDTEDFALRG
ncbi:MAG: glycosyltransferase [Gemmataceae bacterium]